MGNQWSCRCDFCPSYPGRAIREIPNDEIIMISYLTGVGSGRVTQISDSIHQYAHFIGVSLGISTVNVWRRRHRDIMVAWSSL